MHILEIIEKKKKNNILTKEEIEFVIKGYLCKAFTNEQMTALLMAISINELTKEEIKYIIDIITKYSKKVYSKEITGKYVSVNTTPLSKDKTFLLTSSILASVGIKVADITSDTVHINNQVSDNLKAFNIDSKIDVDSLTEKVNKVGISVIEDNNILLSIYNDIYNLCLSTGTMSISLLVPGIIIKNITLAIKNIILDIRVGENSLIKNKKSAQKLINLLTEIGSDYKLNVVPVITDIDGPLSDNYGPALENLELWEILSGKDTPLKELSIELASAIYSDLYGKTMEQAKEKINAAIENKTAYEKYKEFVLSHKGSFDNLVPSRYVNPIKTKKGGKIKSINISVLNEVLFYLKVYKKVPTDIVNLYSGIVLNKKVGDEVVSGEILCYLYQEEKIDLTNLALSIFNIE